MQPPLTRSLTSEEIGDIIKTSASGADLAKEFPCHTQGVECLAKLVTVAPSAVFGQDARDSDVKLRLT